MKNNVKIVLQSLCFVIAISFFSYATQPIDANPLLDKEVNEKVESKSGMSNFTLKDTFGKEHSLSDYTNNAKAAVVLFIATQCPYSNAYNERMVELYNEYQPKGIAFIGINSNKQESNDEVKKHAKENKFQFDVLKDWDNVVADQFEATRTPEIYVLNKELDLLYHGRIDNSHKLDSVHSHDLKKALDEILTGKEVSNKETKAFGCTIKRISK
jgi:peroxiredoxin